MAWELHIAPGAEESVERWSLPGAAGDPLFGLPPLPALDFPPFPFRHLAPFTREEALVFFGRGREIRGHKAARLRPRRATPYRHPQILPGAAPLARCDLGVDLPRGEIR